MTLEEEEALAALLTEKSPAQTKIEFRLYYDSDGKVITYTSENLPGNYIVITPMQYAEARNDVLVSNGQIVYTNKVTHLGKLTKFKNAFSGVKTSKYDVNILTDVDYVYWKWEQYEIW